MPKATRQQFISGLLELAKFLETHPNAPLPYGLHATVFCTEAEGRVARKGMYGWSKDADGSYLTYTQSFTEDDVYAGVEYNIMVNKAETSTCREVVVGTRHVEAYDEEITQWVCGDEVSEGE
jgi:hypothetical protein